MDSGGTLMDRRRVRLRHCTAGLHDAVDSTIEAADLLTSQTGYRRYVAATSRARRSIESRLTCSGASGLYPTWSDCRIAHLVEDDLADLAVSAPIEDIDSRLASMSAGAMLGALYVLQGSAMGARTIARRVSALGMGPEFGARHLAHQAANPKAWLQFLELLKSFPLSDEEESACARAAVATFECFRSNYALIG